MELLKEYLFHLSNKKSKQFRLIVCWIGLAVILGAIAFLVVTLETRPQFILRDFIAYWSAGRLTVTGFNPYNPEQLFALEKEIGWNKAQPILFYNPPWTLLLLAPFSLLDYSVAVKLWLLMNLAIVLFCIDRIWCYYGGPRPYRWLAWIVGIFFFPTIYVLLIGQIGSIILLGLIGVLHFFKKERGWLVGVCAVLVGIKPHIVYLFWIALVFWVIERRYWSVILGMVLAFLGASIMILWLNPALPAQYLFAKVNSPNTLFSLQTPTFGTVLRKLWGWDKIWLQYVPPALGTMWFLVFWAKRHRSWDWGERLPILLLVSLTTTIYTWGYDQVVLLIAVGQVGVRALCDARRWRRFWAITPYIGINCAALYFAIGNAFWYIWMAPSLLLWYLHMRKYLK